MYHMIWYRELKHEMKMNERWPLIHTLCVSLVLVHPILMLRILTYW